MVLFIEILHVLLCLFLILIILLQPGKDSGAVFGGQAGNSAYSARTNANPLGRATTFVAILFMSTSISLAWFSTINTQDSDAMADERKNLEKQLSKSDLEFAAPKLPMLSAQDLMTPVPVPEQNLEEKPQEDLTPEQ